jgi:hypothetical protein
MTTMRRIMGLALPALLLAVGAQAQGLGQGPGLWSSGPYDPINLRQDSVSVIALRNGGTAAALAPQDVTVYQFCDAEPNCTTGYNRARLGWSLSASYFDIAYESAGTGTAKSMRLGQGFGSVQFGSAVLPVLDASVPLGGVNNRFTRVYLARSVQSGFFKTLTEGAATGITNVAIAAGSHTGGRLEYCIHAEDAVDQQTRCGEVKFAAVNKAGTTTCTMNPAAPDQTNDGNAGAITAGTLTYAVTCADVTNAIQFRVNATSSLTQTTLRAEGLLHLRNPQTDSPQ